MGKWTVYAPVLIPTLCRFEHFKRCIDSLSRCTGAEYTDVFIGLDYPANDSHWDGYREICNYVEHITGFNNVLVFKRTTNCGESKNMRYLKDEVRKRYDRFIIAEDDNEFSPNFLEYMNAGLERFRDDPRVLYVCGCLMPWNADFEGCMKGYPYNAFPAKDYNALGVGIWFHKYPALPFSKDSILNSFTLTHKTFRYGYSLAIARCLKQLHKESQLPDVCRRLYCAFYNKYSIFPRISKVKNWGYDGTGLNSDNNEHWIEVQTLDTASSFELDDFEIIDYKCVKDFIKQIYDKPKDDPHIRKRIMKYYLFYRVTGIRVQDVPDGQRVRNVFIRGLLHKITPIRSGSK